MDQQWPTSPLALIESVVAQMKYIQGSAEIDTHTVCSSRALTLRCFREREEDAVFHVLGPAPVIGDFRYLMTLQANQIIIHLCTQCAVCIALKHTLH